MLFGIFRRIWYFQFLCFSDGGLVLMFAVGALVFSCCSFRWCCSGGGSGGVFCLRGGCDSGFSDLAVLWCLVSPVCSSGGGWLLGVRGVCCSGEGSDGGSLLRRRFWGGLSLR
ncbi:hypothetical protein QL285_018991 [Trifolium repens]|nr:hypothetical protein QL285_018991 [Trifolium repens]